MPTHIRSLQNERIKRVVRLRDRRGRQQQQRIIVDGCREIQRAMLAGLQPSELFVCDDQFERAEIQELIALSASSGVEPTTVTSSVFEKMAFGNRSEGIVMVAVEPVRCISEFVVSENSLVCVLERVEKPGNVGAILRTADAAAVDGVVVADGATDLYNPNAIRASLGAIFRVPVFSMTVPAVLHWLREQRFAVFAARVDGSFKYDRVDYHGRSALVLGSEAAGLSEAWNASGITAITLPMLGEVDSLNVSATAAVLFYEALRQRSVR